MKTKTTVNRTMKVRNPCRDARIMAMAAGGLAEEDIVRELSLTRSQVHYVLRREGHTPDPEHLDQVVHLALSGYGTETIVEKTGLTVNEVRASLWLASGEWKRMRRK